MHFLAITWQFFLAFARVKICHFWRLWDFFREVGRFLRFLVANWLFLVAPGTAFRCRGFGHFDQNGVARESKMGHFDSFSNQL